MAALPDKTILILGAKTQQVPTIRTATRMGLRVIALDPDDGAPGFAEADVSYCVDFADRNSCLEIARKHRVDGVLTVAADFPLVTQAFVAEELGLPGASTDTANRATDKSAMRKALLEAGVPSAGFQAVRTAREAHVAVRSFRGPTVVKPALSSGGRGVTRLEESASDRDIMTAYDHAAKFTRNELVLVEEYLTGPEFSVEALTSDGDTFVVAITDKSTSGPPHFVEIGHSQPTSLSHDLQRSVRDVVHQGLAALGIVNSPSHTELRIGPDGPRIVEVAARLGGGCITSHVTPLSTGFDMVRASILLALGVTVRPTRALEAKGAAVRFLTADPGKIHTIRGTREAGDLPGVTALQLFAKIGDTVEPLRDASARLGYVVAVADDPNEAIARCKQALSTIVIETTGSSNRNFELVNVAGRPGPNV